jgi:phosphosulfolactate synthase
MSNSEKASYIHKLADDFTVVSEVGFKDPGRSEQLPPDMWAEYIGEDLGTHHVPADVFHRQART